MRKGQIHWIAIAQAIAIIMVVMYHVRLLNATTGENYVFIDNICGFLGHVHMPVFFLLSGFLLYHTRISANVKIGNLYKDKVLRLVVPFVFCTILGNMAQIVFNGFVKHPHDVTVASFFQSFFFTGGYPWPHRWFLMALILMMLLYPLYKLVTSNKAVEWILLLLLVAIQYVSLQAEPNVFCIQQFVEYSPFFFLGILLCKYRLWQCLAYWWLPFVLWALAIVIYLVPSLWEMAQYGLFAYRLLCACALIATALQLSRYWPMTFSSFRNYVFQIYIFGVVFQAFVELIVWKWLGCPEILVVPFFVLNVLAGVWLPVLLCKMAEKIPCCLLHVCMGLRQ